MTLFSQSSYSQMYGNAAEVPDYIVSNNTAANRAIVANPARFPRADWDQIERDSAWLEFELAARGLTAGFGG